MKTFLELVKENCGEDSIGRVFSYHTPNTWIKRAGGFEAFAQGAEGETITNNTIFIGAELEIGLTRQRTGAEIKEICKKIMETIPCILEEDSSIGGTYAKKHVYQDVEIITAPMTIKRWLELGPNIKKLFAELAEFGFESHNIGSCGLHFHYTMVDKPHRVEIVSRFWHQIQTWKPEVQKIAGREFYRYCRDLEFYDTIVPQECESLDYLKEKVVKRDFGGDEHTITLNLQHENTIEMRLCKGTLNYDTFMARLEFFYNMYIQACSLNVIVQRMTWNKLVSSKHIKAYVIAHNVATLKKAYDWSTKVGVLHKKLAHYDNQVVETMFSTLKECKNLQRDAQKLQELNVAYVVTDIMDYINNAMRTFSNRYINIDSLKRVVKEYMTTYMYNTDSGKEEIQKILKPLHEMLQSKPSIELGAMAQGNDI